jgi:hypothetical protein
MTLNMTHGLTSPALRRLDMVHPMESATRRSEPTRILNGKRVVGGEQEGERSAAQGVPL